MRIGRPSIALHYQLECSNSIWHAEITVSYDSTIGAIQGNCYFGTMGTSNCRHKCFSSYYCSSLFGSGDSVSLPEQERKLWRSLHIRGEQIERSYSGNL